MTTTPTASPELPDLDKLEALAKQAGLNGWPFHGVAFQKAANPAAVLALIALARRAQPEGEAPQAVAVQWSNIQHVVEQIAKFCFGHPDQKSVVTLGSAYAAVVNCLTAKDALDLKLQPLPAPAAQHAESGKEAYMADRVDAQNYRAMLRVAERNGYASISCAIKSAPRRPALDGVKNYSIHGDALAAQQAAAPGSLNADLRGWFDDWQNAMDNDARRAFGESISQHSNPGTPEAPKELGLDIAVAVNQKIGKYIAANKPALMLLNEDELAALYRFQETCEDSDSGGYDVDKGLMKRLAAIGVIESKGFGRYQFTEFGDFVIQRAAQLDGGQGGVDE